MPWVFQYRPAEYDLAEGTTQSVADWWAMNQGQRLAKVGDRIYFLRSGPGAAITAVGEITREPYPRDSKRGNTAVDFVYRWFIDPELTRATIAGIRGMDSVYVLARGMQGTNFQISAEQGDVLDSALADRLIVARPGGAPEHIPLLRRNRTALDGTLEAIKTENGRIVAVQVQFYVDAGEDPAYVDRRLDDGRISLVGRGKRSRGDQRLSHGNKALAALVDQDHPVSFPVYEKVAPNLYRYLGDYFVEKVDYEELDDERPGYKIYRFLLVPFNPQYLGDRGDLEQDVFVDFANDVSEQMPPARKQVVLARIARDRALVTKRKKLAGYRCEKCEGVSSWLTTRGVSYVEAHHIIPLGEDGFDNDRNMIVLCADCHRRLHLGADRHAEAAQLRALRGL
jgi:hypothetical protein